MPNVQDVGVVYENLRRIASNVRVQGEHTVRLLFVLSQLVTISSEPLNKLMSYFLNWHNISTKLEFPPLTIVKETPNVQGFGGGISLHKVVILNSVYK